MLVSVIPNSRRILIAICAWADISYCFFTFVFIDKKRITIQCHRTIEKQGIIFNAIIDWNVRIIQDTPYITLVMVTNN
jgi:hypothetical protein